MKLYFCAFFLSILVGCSEDAPPAPKAVYNLYPPLNKRLIVHSGTKTVSVYPWSVAPEMNDITIDIANPQDPGFLNPTYVLNPGSIDDIAPISNQYAGVFSEIIIEHMGSGLHDTPNGPPSAQSFLFCTPLPQSYACYNYLFRILKAYHHMLVPGGVLLYRGNRYSFADPQGNDFGREQVLKNSLSSLVKILGLPNIYGNLKADEIQQYLQDFYTNLLKDYFNLVEVKVKIDEIYAKYNPTNFPYYYLEIHAVKNMDSPESMAKLSTSVVPSINQSTNTGTQSISGVPLLPTPPSSIFSQGNNGFSGVASPIPASIPPFPGGGY